MNRFVALPLLAAVLLHPLAAFAADATSGVTLDLTGIAVSVIAGVFSVLALVVPLLITSHMNSAADKVAVGTAVAHSLGTMEETAAAVAVGLQPHVTIPGVPVTLQLPVQYVLNHAGTEATRLGETPESIAGKINAQWGITKLVAKQAADAAAALPTPVIASPTLAIVQ